MADFHQTGVISTLHRLGTSDLDRLEREILSYSDDRPVALVLPSLYTELRGPALKGIVEQLQKVPYLRQVVVSLSGAATREQYDEMCSLFQDVRTREGLAWALFHAGQPEAAWTELEQVLAVGVRHPRLAYRAGVVLGALGRADEAREQLQTLLQVESGSPRAARARQQLAALEG